MSKISIEGNASGTGTLTIAAPNTNTNRTLNLPDASGTMVVTGGAQTIEFAAGTAGAPSITFTGDTNTGIFSPTADTIAFSEGGAEAMRIDSSGRVLIGSSSSVGNSNANNLEITNPAGSGVCGLTFNVNSGSANTGNLYWRSNASNNAIQIVGDPISNYLAFATAGAEAMRIDSSGNVGIGTSSPGNKLEVAGLIRATSLTNPTSGSGVELGYDGTQGVIQAFSNRATNTAVPINIQGDLKMNSGYGSSVIAYGCRAWVNFNGTGTPAISEDGNVSSITDNGTGDYTVNFTTAMPDANYSVSGMAKSSDTGGTRMAAMQLIANATATSTSFVRVTVQYDNTNTRDANPVSVAIFR